MKTRFNIILAIITLAILGWTFIQHQYRQNRQFRLQQITTIPIYVYHDSPSVLDSLALDIKSRVSQVDSLIVENIDNEVQALVKSYALDIEPTTLKEYDFPSVLTIYFKPLDSSLHAREKVKDILAKRKLPKTDLDMQEPAWSVVKKELDFLRRSWGYTTLFAAMLVFLVLVFSRMYYLLYSSGKPLDARETILAKIRRRELGKWHSAMLVLVPLAVSLVAYHVLVLLGVIESRVDLVFFGIQAITLLAGSVAAVLLDRISGNSAQTDFRIEN